MGMHNHLDLTSYKWKSKLNNEDALYFEKRDRLDAAIDLFYPESVLEAIVNATTERELDRIMCNARQIA